MRARGQPLSILLIAAAFATTGGCDDDSNGDDGIDVDASFNCMARPDDPSGYLQPICRYIVETFDRYEIDPNTLSIETITPGDQVAGAMPPTNTAAYDHVRLSCCFTGDVAIVDASTREVVGFSLGDM